MKDYSGKVLYINQAKADNGFFRVPIIQMDNNDVILSNMDGMLIKSNSVLYCSQSGNENGDGTIENPFTFQKALEMSENGCTIKILDEIILTSEFKWPVSDKTITVSGMEGAKLDFSNLNNRYLHIYTNTVFENITFVGGSEDGQGNITANGYHVVIKDTVVTENILAGISGGSSTKNTLESTNLEVYAGNYSSIYGGGLSNIKGNCLLTIGGKINEKADSSDEYADWAPYIYGGSWNAQIDGDVVTTVTSDGMAKAYKLFGGCHRSVEAEGPACVKGKIIVNINGGEIMNVYGAATIDSDEQNPLNSTINMNGGKVEALMGAEGQYEVTGNITINALGGMVTRRIIGGMYNNYTWSGWADSKAVNGIVSVVIGNNLEGFTDTQIGNGIFGGSRRSSNSDTETGMLIFTGGAYDKYKNNIGKSDMCDSHHDYLVTATCGGNVTVKSEGIVMVIPNDGYYAISNGEILNDSSFTLASDATNITFAPIEASLENLSYSKSTVSFDYSVSSDDKLILLAVCDLDGSVIEIVTQKTKAGNQKADMVTECDLNDGKGYILKAFLWDEFENINSLCDMISLNVPVKQ